MYSRKRKDNSRQYVEGTCENFRTIIDGAIIEMDILKFLDFKNFRFGLGLDFVDYPKKIKSEEIQAGFKSNTSPRLLLNFSNFQTSV